MVVVAAAVVAIGVAACGGSGSKDAVSTKAGSSTTASASSTTVTTMATTAPHAAAGGGSQSGGGGSQAGSTQGGGSAPTTPPTAPPTAARTAPNTATSTTAAPLPTIASAEVDPPTVMCSPGQSQAQVVAKWSSANADQVTLDVVGVAADDPGIFAGPDGEYPLTIPCDGQSQTISFFPGRSGQFNLAGIVRLPVAEVEGP